MKPPATSSTDLPSEVTWARPPVSAWRREALRLPDGYATSVYVFDPPADVPRGQPVLYAHGIQSHPGWYGTSAAAMARAGHPVYLVTRRGSGDNRTARGHARGAGQLLDDLDAAVEFILAREGGILRSAMDPCEGKVEGNPIADCGLRIADSGPPVQDSPQSTRRTQRETGTSLSASSVLCGPRGEDGSTAAPKPTDCVGGIPSRTRYPHTSAPGSPPHCGVHLLGVSWGGKLLCAYAMRRPHRADLLSLTLVCPGLIAQVDAPPLTQLAVAATFLLAPRTRFAIPLNAPELFTDTPDLQAYLRRDPHRLHTATARMLAVSRQLDLQLARAPRGSIALPTTLIVAARDRIIDTPATRALVSYLTNRRCTLRQLDGAHTLEFEPDPAPLLDAILQGTETGGA